jgi:hypothetical protein
VDEHESFDQALNRAQDNKFNVAISNPCFEFWYVLHFEKTGRSFLDCARVIRYLCEQHLENYAKGADVFEQLRPHTATASRNAGDLLKQQWQDEPVRRKRNPSTEIHLIVQRLQEIAGILIK